MTLILARLALTMAASCALLSLLLATETFGRQTVFCGATDCFVASVLWSLPAYAAMLSVVTAAVLIGVALARGRIGPDAVRIAAVGAALAGAIAYIVASAVSLDSAWAGAFSGRLTPAAPAPLLPPILLTLTLPLWTLSWMLIGVWISLTSLQSLPLRAPRPLVVFGWLAGIALAAIATSLSYAWGLQRVRREPISLAHRFLSSGRLGARPRDLPHEANASSGVTLEDALLRWTLRPLLACANYRFAVRIARIA